MKALRYCEPVEEEHCILGQCSPDASASEASISSSSTASNEPLSYLKCLLKFDNPRWSSVPFVVCCGNFVDEDLIEIKVTFKKVLSSLDSSDGRTNSQNELVIKVKPQESIETFLRLNMHRAHSSPTLSPYKRTPRCNNENNNVGVSDSNKKSNVHTTTSEMCHGQELLEKDLGYEYVLLDMLSNVHSSYTSVNEMEARNRIVTPLRKDILALNDADICTYDKDSSGPPIASLPFVTIY